MLLLKVSYVKIKPKANDLISISRKRKEFVEIRTYISFYWLHGFPGLFTDTTEHIRFFFLLFLSPLLVFRAVD